MFKKVIKKFLLNIKNRLNKSPKLKKKIKSFLEQAISIELPFPQYYYVLYRVYRLAKLFKYAELSISKAILIHHKASYYYALINMQRINKVPLWLLSDTYEKLLDTNPKIDKKWSIEYVYTLVNMNNFDKAEAVLKVFYQSEQLSSDEYFLYGRVATENNNLLLADEAFTKAMELDEKNNSAIFGIGIFYANRGDWLAASEAYKRSMSKGLVNIEIRYKLALALDRCYKWAEAEVEYLKVISLDNDANYHYRLGFVRERMKKYDLAAASYQIAIEYATTNKSYWYYRLGYVLNKLGRYKEANSSFLEQKIIKKVSGLPDTKYNKDAKFKKLVDYTEYYEQYSLEEKTVLYESYHGASISCSPYAIFKSLLSDERFIGYKHVWVINNKNKIPEELLLNSHVIFISRNCDQYMRYLAKAKYLINNTTFPEYFIRKEEQLYLNTWHGTPIKTLGKDIKDDFFAHKNATRNFLQSSHLISPNKFTSDILIQNFDINDIYGGVLENTGYPRQDLMLNNSAKGKATLKELLNITNDKPIVLYAPTWRGVLGGAEFNVEKLFKDLELFKELDINFIFRGHHIIEKFLTDKEEIRDIVVPSTIDTNSLLSIVDVLITDYSSISFDYMAKAKPIIYYVYDRKEYESQRGLYFPLEDIGSEICTTSLEVLNTIKKVVKEKDISEVQKNAQIKFCSYDDGKATNRVIDLFFLDKVTSPIKKVKKSILLFGGSFIHNGVTTSFLNLLNSIDQNLYDITLAVDPSSIKLDEIRLEQFKQLDYDIKVIGRFPRMLTTIEEDWVINSFGTQKVFPSQERVDIMKKAYQREFLRVFGVVDFDTVINFEGYNTYWMRLFSFAPNVKNKVVYLHADMQGEASLRFPYLTGNFQFYKFYDRIISVSSDANIINKESLIDRYDISQDKFDYSNNILNYTSVIEKAKEEISEMDIFTDSIVFTSIGRLSPEKDHQKLIHAFAKVVETYKDSKLIIIGDGPLKNSLKQLVERLSLQKKVFLLGYKENPMPYLKNSDCFVLSSNYEGQGLVLLESMILNIPVISTDIKGPRSVIKEQGQGSLVENSIEGLSNGMLDFIDNNYTETKVFDYSQYNKKAIEMFYTKVLGSK